MTSVESLSGSTPNGHADEATLVRFVDRETLANEQSAVAHVVACVECQARVSAIRRRRARLTAMLDATDSVPTVMPNVASILAEAERRVSANGGRSFGSRQRSSSALRFRRPTRRAVVASLVILSGAALAAQPVTRWVKARWQRPAAGASALPNKASTADATASAATIAFVPVPGEFAIRFDAVPASGTVTVRADTGAKVTADISTGANDEGLFVLPDGLRIRNSASSVATYRVSLPPAVNRVRVHVGTGTTARTVVIELEPGESATIPLQSERLRR